MRTSTVLNEADGPFLSDFRVWEEAEGAEVHAYELAEPFIIRSTVLNNAVVTVPKGFKFDGESIPAWLAWLVKPMGESRRGACVHDYLYSNRGYYTAYGTFIPVDRKTADAVYRELVIAKGLPKWRAAVRWGVLRLVGWKAWNDDALAKPDDLA